MGNLKQRLIKAGRDYNYAEGVKVKATTAVYADQIVYVDGSEGPYLTVKSADADTNALASNGRLLIAKHDIPASGYGVCLPWKLVTSVATNGHTVGDPIYLLDTTDSAPTAANIGRDCPTGDAKAVVVGRITKVGTVADGAGILVNASAPEERVQAGLTATASTLVSGSPVEVFGWTLGAADATTSITVEYPIIVTQVWVLIGGAANITDVFVWNGAASGTDYLASFPTDITATDAGPASAETMLYNKLAIAAEGTISVTRAGGQATDRIIIMAIRG
jgi:hypothetical protein